MQPQQTNQTIAALVLKLKHVPDEAAVSMPGGIEVMTVQNWALKFGEQPCHDAKHPEITDDLMLFHKPTETYHHGNPESEVIWHVQRHEKEIMYHILYTPEIETQPLWKSDGPAGELVKY